MITKHMTKKSYYIPIYVQVYAKSEILYWNFMNFLSSLTELFY